MNTVVVDFWKLLLQSLNQEISRNFREFREIPGIVGGKSREFLKFWRNYGEFIGVLSFFSIFIVDYDILVFNLMHCITCTARLHDRLTL